MAKKKPGFQLPNVKSILLTGAISVFVIGGLFTYLKDHVAKVWASPERQDKLEEQQKLLTQQTTTIGTYVQQKMQEETFEDQQRKAAPPGYRWDSDSRTYVRKK